MFLRVSQPAAIARCACVLRGTRARIVVPQPGFDSMENSPSTNRSLSRMLVSESLTLSCISPDVPSWSVNNAIR
jgi:hypothetical protein